MKTLLIAAFCAGSVILSGCSKESRDEMIERTTKAAKELNGSDKTSGDKDEVKTPDIVAEQQRKERIRQNTQWTAENQALHPVEYCQAQLEEVAKYAKRLEVHAHEIAVAQSAAKRKLSEAEGHVKSLSKFLGETKAAYREADATNKWPMTLNGYQIAKEKAQQTIVETYQRLQSSQSTAASQENILNKLDAKYHKVANEQKNVVALREKIQTTISDIRMKKLVEGEKGIGDALNGINDSMNALCGGDTSEPTLDDLLTTTPEAARKEAFEAIMAN